MGCCLSWNRSGEWFKNIKNRIEIIVRQSFKKGNNPVHFNCNDIYHLSKKVGNGIYCTPFINEAEKYSGISKIKDKSYKTFLMVRVKSEAIRACSCLNSYWVVELHEIRPYRILFKNYR